MQARFHNTSPGDIEIIFIKAGDSETQEELGIEEATREKLCDALLWLPRNVIGKEWAKGGLLLAHWEIKEKEFLRTGSKEAQDKLLLTTAPLVASPVGALRV